MPLHGEVLIRVVFGPYLVPFGPGVAYTLPFRWP